MNILICDDEQASLAVLKKHMEYYLTHHQIRFNLTAATNPKEVTASETIFDLAVLDIRMEHTDGIRLAQELRLRNPKIALFFVTNYDEYQDDAMDLQAFRFLPKPLDPKRLYSGLDKAMEYLDGAYIDLYLSEDGACHRIIADDILYVTREGRRVLIMCQNQEYRTMKKLETFCEQLPQRFFYSVHKSFFVNLHYIQQYSYKELFLTNGTHIPIAPRRQSAFHKFWFEYLRRR